MALTFPRASIAKTLSELGQIVDRAFDALSAQINPALLQLQGLANPIAWTNASLLNSWTNSPGNAKLAYRKDALGQVWGKGFGVAANGGGGNPAYLLPVGLRPKENRQFAAAKSGAAVSLFEVTAGGLVLPLSAVANGSALSFEFSFLAEQ